MASDGNTFTVTLTRPTVGVSWGFRLTGGNDFALPLSLQSVVAGSVSEHNGLFAGDIIKEINGRPTDDLSHEEAKQEIIASGNRVELLIQRGSGGQNIWKPHVTQLSKTAPQTVYNDVPLVQRTSLAANKTETEHIGSEFNRTARPFAGFGGGSTPSGFTAFDHGNNNSLNNTEPAAAPQNSGGFRSVRAPTGGQFASAQPPPQAVVCRACGSAILGVFVRIKGETMHAECFVCQRCGTSLKNQGYYTIGGKMFCEVHAREMGAC